MRVVIIDSGVDMLHPLFQGKMITGETMHFIDGHIQRERNFSDNNGHGTAITGIIAKEAPICEIHVIKIFDDKTELDIDSLLAVLTYIYENIECDIINLSLGVSQIEDVTDLEMICNKLADKGIVLVSAFENEGAISYPAAFPRIIGVTSGINCNNIHEFEYVDDSIVNLCAYGKTQRLAWLKHSYIALGGNSFACAHVTAKILHFINEKKDNNLVDILQQFKENAVMFYNMNDGMEDQLPFEIHKAILFPFNKEMHSLVRATDLLDFDIVGIYDTKYSGNIGMSVNRILKNWNHSELQIVQNIRNIQLEKFDTLILGHVDKLNQFTQIQRDIAQLVNLMVAEGKNIYVFDKQVGKNLEADRYSKFYLPSVKSENMPADRFGKLYRVSKPVVGVFGTSSTQGKFTLQLILRKKFLSLGYKVGQIGTEPQSILFGIDYVYPMGYGSSIEIKGFDTIRYLNFLMHKLSCIENDIIIVGSQSNTIPYDYGNIVQYPLPQMHFLLGTLPDIVCLCVNCFDEEDYIWRTINYIQAVASSVVFALVLYPMNIVDNWRSIYASKRPLSKDEQNFYKVQLSNIFHLPVFILGEEEDMDRLFNSIVDYFGE